MTAAAAILYISSGLTFVACCGLNLVASDLASDEAAAPLLLVNVVLVAGSVLNIVLGYFIQQGRQWARITTIVFCALGILLTIVAVLQDPAGLLGSCLGAILNAVVIGLLTSYTAREYFAYKSQ